MPKPAFSFKKRDYPHGGVGYELREYRLTHKLTYRKLRALIGGKVPLSTLWRAEHGGIIHDTNVRELERFLQGVGVNV